MMKKLESPEDLFEEAERLEKLGDQCRDANDITTAGRMYGERDWFLNEAAKLEREAA